MARDPIERIIQKAEAPIEPRPEFAADLLQNLLAQLHSDPPTSPRKEKSMTTATTLPPLADRTRSALTTRPDRERRVWPGILASAALLLLTLTGAFFALGGPRQWGAIQESSPGVENELIARAHVESMSDDFVNTFVGIGRLTIAPGQTLDSGPDSTYGDGVYLFEINGGNVSLSAYGPAEFTPAESPAATPMPDGGEIILETGDRGVLWPGATTIWRNDGQSPVVVLIASVGEAVDSIAPYEGVDLVKSLSMKWPQVPATFALHRITFDPGASLPVADLPGLMVLGVDSGKIDIPLSIGEGTRDRSFDPRDGFIAKDWTVDPNGDIRNSGSDTVVVYVLLGESIEPAASPEA